MNWEALGAIGETLGAVAVLVTLAYVAVQVRHARDEVRRSTSRARSEARRDALAMVSDARTLALLVKANVAEGAKPGPFNEYAMTHWGMTQEQAILLNSALNSGWLTRLQTIAFVDELGAYERHDFERELRFFYARPGPHRRYFELNLRPAQHPDVIRYIDGLLAKAA